MSFPSDNMSAEALLSRQCVQEGIPPSRRQRKRIVQIARQFVRDMKLTPPLRHGELQQYSEELIASADIDPVYRPFVLVVLNNETWRDVMSGIPFERRLLLLPQCLRDSRYCKAEIDEMGLLCAHCGRCIIHHLQAEAQRLGYVVLVAEGSPVVMSLIESGQVEAIVGVSCLSVLERVSPYMEAAAVPGMAVPLLCDGCKDTRVDLEWLWDVIHLSGGADASHLDIEALRRRTREWFTLQALADDLGEPRGATERVGQDWLAQDGKRWRPLLALCACEALADSDKSADRNIQKVALSVECFHKASLIHDDIEDADAERYGRPTLHELHGQAFALNVGDFLLGEGYRLLAELSLSAEQKAEMVAAAAVGHRTLCLGQGAELQWSADGPSLSVDEVLEIFRLKTAPAFEVALHLGAICAGASADVRDALSQYSQALGIAYQIHDDIEDWTDGDGDAVARPSIISALARCSGASRPVVTDDVYAAARRLMESYKDRAIQSLCGLDNAGLKLLLRRLVSKIFGDLERMDFCDNPPRDA